MLGHGEAKYTVDLNWAKATPEEAPVINSHAIEEGKDGLLYLVTDHPENAFLVFKKDGTLGLRFKLDEAKDSLTLNFADPALKTVHVGHIFKVIISPTSVRVVDQKSGEMNLELRKARQAGSLTKEQEQFLLTTSKTFSASISTDEWHQVVVTVKGDEFNCTIDGNTMATFQSDGFAHETKSLLRLLAAHNAWIDDVQIWRKE